jgi:hypothetical protein
VPHPLPFDRLADVAGHAGLGAPTEVARRPSAFHSEMYCAVIARRSRAPGSPGGVSAADLLP